LGQAEALVAGLAERQTVEPKKVAVLLPLSGRFAPVGKELRAAIELAAAASPFSGGATIVWIDTAGEEERAAAAVDDLAAKDHPAMIIGPVGEREATAAAARAAALGIPIALLSPAEGLADASAGVVRLVSSAEGRARAAARAAIAKGFEAPAVLAPRDDVGRAEAAAFVEAFRAAGIDPAAAGEFDPTATDLEPDVKRFLGLDPATNERLRKHLRKHPKDGWKTFSPDIYFDLLYIPARYDQAALIAAFLVYFNVELRTDESVDSVSLRKKHGGRLPSIVQLMGSAGWHDPALIARGAREVEGAYVVDDFVAEPAESDITVEYTSAGAEEFSTRWRARMNRAPTAAAAQAWDATLMAFSARRVGLDAAGSAAKVDASGAAADGPRVRAAIASALAAATLDDGACGPARIDAAGELFRGGVLLHIEGGAFVVDTTID
jgi:branched-chain amino acid transport system substrate-binding protein